MAGDAPELTSCVGGRCVDPACSELAPDLCAPGECSADADCAPPSECAVGVCVEGGCLYAANDSACAPGQTCSPTMGCIGVMPPMDAGMDTGAPDADATVDSAVDTGPTCATEVLLASTMEHTHTGGFSGVYSSLNVKMAANPGFGAIGDEADQPLPSGFMGTTVFTADDDPDFDTVVAPFMDGSVIRVSAAVAGPGTGGAYMSSELSAPVDGTIITRVHRNVASLTFTIDGASTDYDATVSWELWGCSAP
jgi:hypothetical protein